MLNAVPATGPSAMLHSICEPAMYIGNGAAGRFDVAKSRWAAWPRAKRVTADVGSRLATRAMLLSVPPPRIAARSAAIMARMRSSRAGPDIASPGTRTRTGVNEFEPDVESVRVLMTKETFSASTGTPRLAW